MNLLEWGDRRLLPLLFATIIPALVSGRILHHLHQHQRQGSRLPSETENFLLELAIMIPAVRAGALLTLTGAV